MCRARDAHRFSSAAVTPGKRETRREDERTALARTRGYPAAVAGDIRDLKFARFPANECRAHVHTTNTPASLGLASTPTPRGSHFSSPSHALSLSAPHFLRVALALSISGRPGCAVLLSLSRSLPLYILVCSVALRRTDTATNPSAARFLLVYPPSTPSHSHAIKPMPKCMPSNVGRTVARTRRTAPPCPPSATP